MSSRAVLLVLNLNGCTSAGSIAQPTASGTSRSATVHGFVLRDEEAKRVFSAEADGGLAGELSGIANRVTVILPCGSLLRGLVQPETSLLHHFRRLCAAHAYLEIVFSYDQRRDAGKRGPLRLAGIQESHVRIVLPQLYQSAGFCVISAEAIERHDLRAYETAWAKRLASGRPREIWRLRAIAEESRDSGIESERTHAAEPS